ncbi:MAG TPA: GGDEF-domain containing protein, partial [Actinoplanes sp.]|nr:GGDEF-domain containing protein [Actinoplanes sp.]
MLYLLNLSATVSMAAFAVIGVGVVWACFSGPRRYRAQPGAAWLLLCVAALLFLIGVLIRPWATEQPFPLILAADAVAIPGYVLTAAFFVVLLRVRRGADWLALLDGLIVCVAGGLACALLLAAPAAAVPGRPVLVSVLAGMYPLLDMVLVLLVVNLTFTTSTWPLSLLTFLGTMTLLFAGDLAYAIIGTSGRLYASPLLDVPFLLAYTLFGVTTLHPSVAELSRAGTRPVQAWSWRRMALLAPALATPFVLLVTIGDHSAGYRLTIAVTGAVMVLLLLVRAVSAVQAQAAAQLRSEHQARHDPLTGLPNRGMISAEIERLLRRLPSHTGPSHTGPSHTGFSAPSEGAGSGTAGTQRVWVYLLDLDGFKWVNESWG